MEETSKYSISVSYRNNNQCEAFRSLEAEQKPIHQNSFLEKTTPRSSRPGYVPQNQI